MESGVCFLLSSSLPQACWSLQDAVSTSSKSHRRPSVSLNAVRAWAAAETKPFLLRAPHLGCIVPAVWGGGGAARHLPLPALQPCLPPSPLSFPSHYPITPSQNTHTLTHTHTHTHTHTRVNIAGFFTPHWFFTLLLCRVQTKNWAADGITQTAPPMPLRLKNKKQKAREQSNGARETQLVPCWKLLIHLLIAMFVQQQMLCS